MKSESISITLNTAEQDTVQLLLQGQLVIKNAKAIKSELISVLGKYRNIGVVLKNIIRIDLPVLQLLTALQKSCSTLEVSLSFDFELSDYLQYALANSGFDKILLPNLQQEI